MRLLLSLLTILLVLGTSGCTFRSREMPMVSPGPMRLQPARFELTGQVTAARVCGYDGFDSIAPGERAIMTGSADGPGPYYKWDPISIAYAIFTGGAYFILIKVYYDLPIYLIHRDPSHPQTEPQRFRIAARGLFDGPDLDYDDDPDYEDSKFNRNYTDSILRRFGGSRILRKAFHDALQRADGDVMLNPRIERIETGRGCLMALDHVCYSVEAKTARLIGPSRSVPVKAPAPPAGPAPSPFGQQAPQPGGQFQFQ